MGRSKIKDWEKDIDLEDSPEMVEYQYLKDKNKKRRDNKLKDKVKKIKKNLFFMKKNGIKYKEGEAFASSSFFTNGEKYGI